MAYSSYLPERDLESVLALLDLKKESLQVSEWALKALAVLTKPAEVRDESLRKELIAMKIPGRLVSLMQKHVETSASIGALGCEAWVNILTCFREPSELIHGLNVANLLVNVLGKNKTDPNVIISATTAVIELCKIGNNFDVLSESTFLKELVNVGYYYIGIGIGDPHSSTIISKVSNTIGQFAVPSNSERFLESGVCDVIISFINLKVETGCLLHILCKICYLSTAVRQRLDERCVVYSIQSYLDDPSILHDDLCVLHDCVEAIMLLSVEPSCAAKLIKLGVPKRLLHLLDGDLLRIEGGIEKGTCALLNMFNNYESHTELLNIHEAEPILQRAKRAKQTDVHGSAWKNIDKLLKFICHDISEVIEDVNIVTIFADVEKPENNHRILELLRGKKHLVNMLHDERKQKLLHLSCLHGNDELSGRLIELQADVNARDDSGTTALHLAAWYGNVDLVKMLLNEGADYRRLDKTRRTPLDCVGKLSGDPSKDAIVRSLIEAKVHEDEQSWLERKREKSKRKAAVEFHRGRLNSNCPSTFAEVIDILNWPHMQIKDACKLEFDDMFSPTHSSEHVVFPTILTHISSDGIERKYATVVKFCIRTNNDRNQGASLFRSPSGSEITLMSQAHLQQTLINYKQLDDYIKGGYFERISVVPVSIIRVTKEWLQNIEYGMELDQRLILDPLLWVEERLEGFRKFIQIEDNPDELTRGKMVDCLTSADSPELFQLQKHIYEVSGDKSLRTVCDLQGAIVTPRGESTINSSFCSFHSFEGISSPSLIVLCDVEFTDTLEKLDWQQGELLTGFVSHLFRESLAANSSSAVPDRDNDIVTGDTLRHNTYI